MSQSKGQYRIGVSFNPSGDQVVNEIKQKAAEMLDLIDKIPSDSASVCGNERGRLKALATTHIENGAMWAVKAATKPEPV